jgi:hypothetical protein
MAKRAKFTKIPLTRSLVAEGYEHGWMLRDQTQHQDHGVIGYYGTLESALEGAIEHQARRRGVVANLREAVQEIEKIKRSITRKAGVRRGEAKKRDAR